MAMMALLEDAGFVAGRYEQRVVDGLVLRERHYEVKAAGKAVWRESRDFYSRLAAKSHPGFAQLRDWRLDHVS